LLSYAWAIASLIVVADAPLPAVHNRAATIMATAALADTGAVAPPGSPFPRERTSNTWMNLRQDQHAGEVITRFG
ncbi:MAG: hypothetical protein U1E33_04155, partial [Rhodospirillales bacterium]